MMMTILLNQGSNDDDSFSGASVATVDVDDIDNDNDDDEYGGNDYYDKNDDKENYHREK